MAHRLPLIGFLCVKYSAMIREKLRATLMRCS
uniref:Uncharacterized protein n=1 Tax=Parascaris equorum TaxID=6256 RepID=A0A914RV85_PAREQ